jgi:nicotinamidase-related amidase
VKTKLLIIDPQVDFCDPKGALYVKGAEQDMTRLAAMVDRISDRLDDIQVTLDSHQLVHIAHPIFWRDTKGAAPAPLTVITMDSVVTKKVWRARCPALQAYAEKYVTDLEKSGRYVLVIWPPHCLIGTPGHNVSPILMPSLLRWQEQFALVNFVTKGSNMLTEHYSVVKADVPDPEDPTTSVNSTFIRQLEDADEILIAGEALSHCVANSVRDIANEFGDDQIRKLVLLTDASSNVPGFEKLGADFVREMTAKGMRLAKTTDYV